MSGRLSAEAFERAARFEIAFVAIREATGLTQEDAAALLGIHRNSVQNVLRRQRAGA